jgi:uncharacterized protein YdeI (YjbR/CyaY-like superfamily)
MDPTLSGSVTPLSLRSRGPRAQSLWQTPGMVAHEIERHPSDGWAVLPFETKDVFESWLDRNHADQPGVWVKFAKQGRGIASISLPEAIEVALCFGWIDSKTYRYDDDYYILRYQPRRPKSVWSARNKDLAERLIADGRMRASGLAQVEAAKADGRWDAARS